MSVEKIIFIIICVFAVIGGIDRMIGNKFGLGAAFEKGIVTMGPLLLTMSGMIVLSPVIAYLLRPVVVPFYEFLGADPAMFAGSFFACDMGGYTLAKELSTNANAVRLGGIIASSMLGVTITFTIPVAMGVVSASDRPFVAKGILCGILTIPFGIFVGGLIIGCAPLFIIRNMLPDSQLERLQNGTRRAEEKGIKESLVMVDNLAFIVNVRNNTVITAVNEKEDKVFTNIDGAVIA